MRNCFFRSIESVKPEIIIINGDWYDFSSIARFHRIGWQHQPTLADELKDGTEKLALVEKASPKSKFYFVPGNHDMRFDGKIANELPQFEDVKGLALVDHLPAWNIGLCIVVNDCMLVKHRWHGGVHACYNNVLRAGKSFVTGHTHRLMVYPWTDLNGIRYGVESGCLSDLWDESFLWKENNPASWQSGAIILECDGDTIIPRTCPMVIDKTHRRCGKMNYNGSWYG